MSYIPVNPENLANNLNYINAINDSVTLYEDYSQNKPTTTDAISVAQDFAGLANNPFLNGTLFQTESVTLMQYGSFDLLSWSDPV